MVMPKIPGLQSAGGEQNTDEELRKQIEAWLKSQAAGQDYNTLLGAYKQQFPTADEKYLKDIAGTKGVTPVQAAPTEKKTGWEQEVSPTPITPHPWGTTAAEEAATEQKRIKTEQERIATEQLQKTQQQQTVPGEILPGGRMQETPEGTLRSMTTSEDTYLAGIKDLSARLGTEVNFPAQDISQMSGQERRIYRDNLRETYRNLLHLDQQRQSGKIPQGWQVQVTEPENPGGVPWEYMNNLTPEQQKQFMPQTKTAEEIQAMSPDMRAEYFKKVKAQNKWGIDIIQNEEGGYEPAPQSYGTEYTTPGGFKITGTNITDPQGHTYSTDEALATHGVIDRIAGEFHPVDVQELQTHAESNPADFVKWLQNKKPTPMTVALAKAMGLENKQIDKIFPGLQNGVAMRAMTQGEFGKVYKGETVPLTEESGLTKVANFFKGLVKNPYAKGGLLESMAVHPDNMDDSAAALSLTFMATIGTPAQAVAPAVNIAGTTPYVGKLLSTLTSLGFDTSMGVVPDYIQAGINKAFKGIANAKVMKEASTYVSNAIDKGETLEQMVKGLSTIVGMDVKKTKDALTKAGVEIISKSPAAQVPVMITKKMEADLLAKGFTQEAINKMTPSEAWSKLGGVAGKTTETVTPKVAENIMPTSFENFDSVMRTGYRRMVENMLLKGETPETIAKMLTEGTTADNRMPKDAIDYLINDVQRGLEKTGGVERRQAVRAGAETIPEVTPKVGGTVPPVKPPAPPVANPTPPNSELAKVEAMWEAGRIKKPMLNMPEGWLKLQEQINDSFYGLRRMQSGLETKGVSVEPGGKTDITTLLTRSPGISNAGATRYLLALDEIKKVAPNAAVDDINSIIYLNHAREIMSEKGTERVMAGGFTDISQLDTALANLKTKLGQTGFDEAIRGAEVAKNVYDRELTRLVDSGLIDKDLGELLRTKYPWYNPLQYLDDAEQLAVQGKSVKPYTVVSSGLKRLTEKGTEKAAQDPLSVMADQLVKNEVRIHKNETARAIVELALEDPALGVTKVKTIRPVAKIGEIEIPEQTLGTLKAKVAELDKEWNEAIEASGGIDTGKSIRLEEQIDTINKQIRSATHKGLKDGDIVAQATTKDEFIWRPYKGDIPGTISYFENGKRQVYEVPDWIYREAEVLSKTMSNPISSLIGSLNGISRAAFTSMSPPFVISNMLNDTINAFMRGGITPVQTGQRLIQSLKGLENDSVMQAFKLAGGSQARFYGEDLAKEVTKHGGQVLNTNESIIKRIWKSIPQAGEAGEQAPRMAYFKKELDKTLPGWKNMTAEQVAKTPEGRKAAAGAVELTINFGRGGYLVKSANPFIIFLNANMEGMKLPFRALREVPAAKWRLAGTFAGMMGLSAYNMSYPEYFDVPNNIRWGSVMVMLPSVSKDEYGNNKPNYVTVIPRTREWSAFLGSGTYAMEKIFKDSPTEFGTFTSAMAPMTLPFSEIPMPAVIAELAEQGANWDFYRSQPIIPQSMANVPPAEQVQPWTSPTIAAIASRLGQSPMRWQHAFSGIFGGAGQTFMSVPDYIGSLLAPDETDQRIGALADTYKSITDSKAKRDFLSQFSSVDKNAIMAEVRKPQAEIPVLGPIAKRVYPGQTGQIYQTQREQVDDYIKAANELNKLTASKLTDTTPKVERLLGKFNPQEQAMIWRLTHVKQADQIDFAIDQLPSLRR